MEECLLEAILNIQGNHENESGMQKFIKKFISGIEGVSFKQDKIGNIIVEKNLEGVEYLPAVASHMDTVFETDKNFSVVLHDGRFFTPPYCDAGIGGDDRCGIYICLELLLELPNLKVFFFTGEEVGCVGSNFIDLNEFNNCRFVIQPDRKGNSDLITNYNGQDTCGETFLGLLKSAEEVGFKHTTGIYTDVMTLLQRGLDISVMNISCGYYNAHTPDEYIVISDLAHTLDTVRGLIKYSADIKYFNNYSTIERDWVWFEEFSDDEDSEEQDYDFCDNCGKSVNKTVHHLSGILCEDCFKELDDEEDGEDIADEYFESMKSQKGLI